MLPPDLDRRRFLFAGSGMLLVSGLAPVRVWANPQFRDDPFTLGVAAGDPLPDGFVIWTRLAPEPLEPHGGMRPRAVEVGWEVAEDEGFQRVVRSGEATALPDLAHAVHVEVDGLRPGRPYWYRFTIDRSARSPVGTARTAPAPGTMPERVRIGVAGCQRYEVGYFDAYRHLSREADLDAIFHYGDYIYVGAGDRPAKVNGTGRRVLVRAATGPKVLSLDDFRQRYAQYKMDPDLQAAHASAAFITSYDDGEVANDFTGDLDEAGTPPEVFALRRFAAMQAWYEHMPVRKAQFPHLSGLTMFRRLDYGRLFRMHVLDTRAYRTDQPCMDGHARQCGTQDGPDATVLGRAQEAWLAQGLANDARWNFIAQQVLLMPFNTHDTGEASPIGWNPYPEARARLVRTITERKLTNVVVASGGAHQNFIGDIPVSDAAPDGPAAAAEFECTSISSGGDGVVHRPESEAILRNTPNLAYINAQRGYQLFDVSPKEWRAAVKVIDRVQTKGGALSTAANFVVEPGRPGVQRG